MKQARILTFTLVLFSLLLFIGLMPVHGEEEIYESVVRLHVLAHSDSEEDQALKLAVRDAVLAYTSPLLAECKDREEAEARLRHRDATAVHPAVPWEGLIVLGQAKGFAIEG